MRARLQGWALFLGDYCSAEQHALGGYGNYMKKLHIII
jgi:hypothetical protein